MLKLMLLLIIFVTSSYLGFMYGETFKKRYFQLTETLKAISILESQIIYGSTPLPEAFGNISFKLRSPLKDITEKIKNRLIDGNIASIYDCALEEYEKMESEFNFSNSDKRIIGDLFKSLGDSGVYGQEKIFSLAIENIKFNIEEAKENEKKNTKLYRYLGICFGAMIIIFLA